MPEGWYIATDNETKELIPYAARIMGPDDPNAKSVVAQMSGMLLLIVSKQPFSSNVQSQNRNTIILYEKFIDEFTENIEKVKFNTTQVSDGENKR